MSEDPSRDYAPPTPQHRVRTSLITSASGIADSTISFNTYATGITEGSLCLSQFPPPPTTIPSSASPTTERFLPSPARSTFTVTAPQRPGPSTYYGQSSPANSTFTVMTPPQLNHTSGSASPLARPVPVSERDLPSPAQSTFTVSTPVSANIAPLMPTPGAQLMSSPLNRQFPGDSSPSRGPGRIDGSHSSDSRSTPQSATFRLGEGKLSPHDWHEGSSIISVDAQEERMLSTSFITELLSSTSSLKSPVGASPRGFHHPSQADVGSLVSEMSYPPSSSRHLAGSSRFPPSSHPSAYPGKGTDSLFSGENDTVASLSYEGQSVIGQPAALGLTRKVSLLGMAPATLRHISSDASIPESLHPQSQVTYGSTAPLNPHPPSAFPSLADKMRASDIQPSIGTPQTSTPERHESLDFDTNRRSFRYLRRESTYSSRTVRSHVTSLISAAGQRTVNVARATMEWMRIKPLPPLPTIPNISTHQAQQHQRMEGSLPLPQLAERADRLNVMLDAGHFPHDDRASPRLGSDKDSPFGARASGLKLALGNRRRQSVNVRDSQSDCSRSPLKPKSCFRRPMSRRGRIKLFIGASVLAVLALIGIVVGVTLGRKHARSPSCSANRTGNTCNLGKLCSFFLAAELVYRPM